MLAGVYTNLPEERHSIHTCTQWDLVLRGKRRAQTAEKEGGELAR